MLESFKITAELIGMDTWKHKLKNTDLYLYFTLDICKHIEPKVGKSFPCGFPVGKRQNFKETSKAFRMCSLLVQALGKRIFFSLLVIVAVS